MLQKLRMPFPLDIKGEDVVALPQAFDNAVEEVSSAFPKGKKYDENWSFPYLC